jgi:ABC-type uncharacterized transport system substrate-binding protein
MIWQKVAHQARAFILSFLLLSAIGIGRAWADKNQPAYESWFKYHAAVGRSWDLENSPVPYMLTLRHKKQELDVPRHRIFVIYSKDSSAYDVAITTILSVFDDKDINAEFTVFNFQNNEGLGQEALRVLEARRYDMVFSMGSESTAWLWQNYRGGKVPVVSVCSKDPVALGQVDAYDRGTGTNFAFTSLNMPVEAQMAYLLELKPTLRNLGVLVDSTNISAVETQAKPIVGYARRHGIQVLDVSVEHPNLAREELAGKVEKTVSIMRKSDPTLDHSVFWITGSTAVFREIRVINANSDRVPVLSVVPEVVQTGDDTAVIAIGVSFESNAHLAAIYAEKILLSRTKVSELPVGIVSPPDIAISFRKAREIGLSVPFSFFESAAYIYDYEGLPVRTSPRTVSGDHLY